jgi:superfamily II DNA/RNA helicase
VEYIVFDEADRLFEMGFAPQIQEIIQNLPEKRFFPRAQFSFSFSFPFFLIHSAFPSPFFQEDSLKIFLFQSRQTVLVSATMPSLLVEFAKAGDLISPSPFSLSLSLYHELF